MSLVKLVRKEPEVKGGKTIAYLPEESVQKALDKGWKRAETKTEVKKEETVSEPSSDFSLKDDSNKTEVVKKEVSQSTGSKKRTSKK